MSIQIISGAAQPVVLFDSSGTAINTNSEGTVLTLDAVHERIHNGQMFQNSYKSPDASPIADDASIDILISTSTKVTHIVFGCSSGGDSETLFYEDTEVSDNGTLLNTSNNMNRLSNSLADTRVYVTPTIVNPGVILLVNTLLAGGTGGNAAGAGTGFTWREWILKMNSNYMIRCINRSGQPKPMSIDVQWYETITGVL